MTFIQTFLEALESLTVNRLRSGLTSLGIVIGVAAVIALLAIGRGAETSITKSIEVIGTNLLFIFPEGLEEVRNPKPLTLGDAEAIAERSAAPSVLRVAPVLSGSAEISYAGETTSTEMRGITSEFGLARNFRAAEGEFISDVHVLGHASVVVLGTEVANRLFGRIDGLVGKKVHIEGQPFRVIGVLESKGGTSLGSEDDLVLVPLTTARARLLKRGAREHVDLIVAQAVNASEVPKAVEEIARVLRSRHRTRIGADDFRILTQQEFLDTFTSITLVLTVLLGGIAAISLMVGGIGIMNIMLVAVTERTREIGLRKAIGARKRDILFQILAESLLLSLVGGLAGTALGWGLSVAIGRVAEIYNADITPVVSLDIILLATLFSAAVGLFFGIYPANRAANLEPVEALRYE